MHYNINIKDKKGIEQPNKQTNKFINYSQFNIVLAVSLIQKIKIICFKGAYYYEH